MEYIRLLEKWKTSTQPIRVNISDCDFNLAMSIDKLTKKHREGDRDVYYTLELSEYRFLNVPAVQVEAQQQSDTSGLNSRPNTQTVPRSCTVVSLSLIHICAGQQADGPVGEHQAGQGWRQRRLREGGYAP